MIRYVFAPIDVDAILSIPLASYRQDDILIRHYGSSDSFTVRSAYFLCMSTTASPTCSGFNGEEVQSDLVAFDIQLVDQIDDDSSFIDLLLWFKQHAPVNSLFILCVVCGFGVFQQLILA
ncbi:hypothetical protein ACOSQ3_012236 [Xanthoceras sorbifolium]